MGTNIKPEYLGDGVYVNFNANLHVVISIGHHEAIVAYLEPEIAQKLVEYIKKTQELEPEKQ